MELGGKTRRPCRSYTLLQEQIQLWHSAFPKPGLGCAIAETRARTDPEALATVSLHFALLQHPPLISIPGAELLLIKPRPARAWQGTQAGRNCQGAKGRPDRLIPSFMKKGRLLPESSKGLSVDVVLLGGSAWPGDRQHSIMSTEQAAAESGARGYSALVPTSFLVYFCSRKYSRVGLSGGQAPLHLHKGTTKARQSSLLSCKKARAVPVHVLGHSLDVDHMGVAQSTWSQSWLAPQLGFHGHLCTTEPGASEGAGLQGTPGSPADRVAVLV